VAFSAGTSLKITQGIRRKNRGESELTTYDPLYLAGIDCFNRQDFFESHEIWEDLWAETCGEAKTFYKGLIQAAVALHHATCGNAVGAERLLARSCHHLAAYRPWYLGLDVDLFLSEVSQCVEQARASLGPSPCISLSPALHPTIRLAPPLER
jgi:predicted metal-dependent hydrolase